MNIIEKTSCDMCGEEMFSDGVCTNCGNTISPEANNSTIASSEWGIITFNLKSVIADNINLKENIFDLWKSLEDESIQKLFPKQILPLPEKDRFELIGAKESYLIFREFLSKAQGFCESYIKFKVIPIEEVYKLRESFEG